MELLNNIWNALTTPNETLISIILLPSAIIETILTLIIFTTVFNQKATFKQIIIYIFSCSILTFLSISILPSPINTFVNYAIVFIVICILFRTSIFKGLLSSIISTVLFALVGTLIMNPYFTLFNITYEQSETIPIYRILYLLLMYFIVFCIILLLKFRKFKIEIFDYEIDKKSKKVLFINLAIGLITLLIQLIITIYYTDILPVIITFLSFLSLLAYFSISIYSLTRVMKLASTTQKLQNCRRI